MKKYLIFLFVMCLILISSAVSANSDIDNITSDEILQNNDIDSLSIEITNNDEKSLIGDSNNYDELSISDNDCLVDSSNNVIVNPDFEDYSTDDDGKLVIDGWNYMLYKTGDINIGNDEVHGNYVSYSSSGNGGTNQYSVLYQKINLTEDVENITFEYNYPHTKSTKFSIAIVNDIPTNVPAGSKKLIPVTAADEWKSYSFSASNYYNGDDKNYYLVFYVAAANIYASIDSIKTVYKQKDDDIIEDYVGNPIEFNYTTTDNITGWLWDFGDGTYSNLSNPTHVYTKEGTYEVILKITTNESETKVITYLVDIIEEVVADFEYDGIYSGEGTALIGFSMFTDKTSGSPVGGTWFWGDGSNSQLTSNYHKFTDILTTNVTLTVIDKFGVRSSKTKTITFYNSVGGITDIDYPQDESSGWTFNEDGSVEKVIDFDELDYILLDLTHPNGWSGSPDYFGILTYLDGIKTNLTWYYTHPAQRLKTTTKLNTETLNGIHNFRMEFYTAVSFPSWNLEDKISFVNSLNSISYGTYDYVADCIIESTTVENGNFTVSFKDSSSGSAISAYVWEFDDGEKYTSNILSNALKATHTFTSGDHWVKLHIYHDDVEMDCCIYHFTLTQPTVNGESYDSIQDAINNANENDTIEIEPVIGGVFSENIVINKSLTLNFNGAVLTPKDSNAPLFNITDGATVTVTNLGLNKESILVTDSDSKLIIKDSDIEVDLDLSEGNVDLVDDSFNGSVLTLVANTNIANSTVNGGSVIVNGGKSKIYNSTLTGCDVAVSQTAGELEIISNILTGNDVAVNVTGGKTNIAYNLIYNNAKFGLVYVGDDVVFNDNWWATNDDPSRANGESLSDDYFDVYRLEEDSGVDEFSYLTLKFSSDAPVMGINKEYPVTVMLTNDGNEIEGYIKTVDLTVNDEYLVTLENNQGTFTIKTSDAQSENTILSVLNQEYTLDVPVLAETDVIVSVDGEAVADGSVDVIVEVPYATGSVTFYVNGKANPVELNENIAKYTIDNLAAGNYSIVVVYNGDDVFDSIVNTTSFNVEPSENLTALLEEAIANATALAGNLTEANQKIDDLTSQLAEAQSKVLVGSVISAADLKVKAGNAGIIQVTLKDANNNLLANKNVSVIINGVTYKGLTNANGVASISVKFASAGTYNAVVSFMGDETLKSSIGTSKVIVSKKATTLTAKKATLKVKKVKKIKVTLKSAGKAVAGKTVTIKVNKKTFKAKTNKKGVATIKVKVAKKGKFKAVVKFAGDSAYKAVSKKVKLTVKK